MKPTTLLILLSASISAAFAQQEFTQRGFIESYNQFYPDTVPIDRSNIVSDELFREDMNFKLTPNLQINAAFDGRFDSHQQVERTASLDFWDRGLQRPAMSIRDLNLVYTKGRFTATLGKQFIRWGKSDILNPTDRFAPHDFLTLTDDYFLGVTAARFMYDTGKDSIDAIVQPWFTPSRTPLLNQRWTPLPPDTWSDLYANYGSAYPGRASFGVRWNHTGSAAEYSFNYYDGFDNLPLYNVLPAPSPDVFGLQRFFPELREMGGDLAVPMHWATIKGEIANFSSSDKRSDQYVLYVLQLQRQIKEWNLVGGYAGEVVYDSRSPFFFSPERGYARSFLGRAGWTIDPRSDLSVQGIVKQNGRGGLLEATYSHTFGQHWRATVGYVMVRGDENDFIGQYRHNSHEIVSLRYSF
ncbi:MAG TPA: hypothetical protein VFA04_00260 [Bryobacteraceae bacterium]|nr:hypothetical protein [Bryobacteraceae bacterium]